MAQLQAMNVTHHLGETLPKLKEGKQGLRLLLVPMTEHAALSEQLADFLKSVSIDFSLTTNDPQAQQTADVILCHHPQTIQLQTQRKDFLKTWQQTIDNQRVFSPQIITGLVVACPTTIQYLLGVTLQRQSKGTAPDDRLLQAIQLKPGTFSVLHYPASNYFPILQTLNFGVDLSAVSIFKGAED